MNSRCTCMILCIVFYMFFFKQKTAYEMRISDWSSDVCSSDLNLRKQWHQELQDKFNLQGSILEAKSYNALRKHGQQPFRDSPGPVICSYQFAKSKADDIKAINWDLVVLDEAHRLRNVYKKSNVIAKTLKDALATVQSQAIDRNNTRLKYSQSCAS